jgi:SAM-dependent methyltransferase
MTTPISDWVARWAPLAAGGKALDLACGTGRHAHHLAALGHPVLAVDRDASALIHAAGEGIVTLHADLEEDSEAGAARLAVILRPGQFSLIVVTNYLHRPLMPLLMASLTEDGMLIYETFAAGNEVYGKPSNPAFLLQSGELRELAGSAGLRVLAFEDATVQTPKPAVVQRICAVGPAFPVTNVKEGVSAPLSGQE